MPIDRINCMSRCCVHMLVLMMVCLVSACSSGGASPINYYIIDPIDSDLKYPGNENLSLEILDLHVPQYLERFQIATRSSSNQLVFSDNQQWGENLRKNLTRTLARNLSNQLGIIDIGTPISRSSTQADLRLQVYIESFEQDERGYVILSARWQITDGQKNQTLTTLGASFSEPSSQGNYPETVNTMTRTFADLCDHIARSVDNIANPSSRMEKPG